MLNPTTDGGWDVRAQKGGGGGGGCRLNSSSVHHATFTLYGLQQVFMVVTGFQVNAR